MNRRRQVGALLAVGCLLLGACSSSAKPDEPRRATDRLPTVATTTRVSTTDPVAAIDEGSQFFAYNTFQRLLTTRIGDAALKPDLASDCWYIDPLTYSCGIAFNRIFSSGRPVTSVDVKYSLDRARRLAVPGSSARMLDSIERIDAPEELRIDIKLKYPDSNIGFALASPGASIVDSQTFPADALLPQDRSPVGSGPYVLAARTLEELVLRRHARYVGPSVGHFNEIAVKTFSSLELMNRAIGTGTVDLLWRVGPPPAAASTKFRAKVLPGADVSRLVWNPRSPLRTDPHLRRRVVDATGPIRSLHRLLPEGVEGGVDTFPTGPAPSPEPSGPSTAITLAMSGRNEVALANLPRVQQALEQAGFEVRTIADPSAADLVVDAGTAFTNTPLAWLQDWWDYPLPDRESRARELLDAYRTAPSVPARIEVARTLQQEATADATVLPLTQGDRQIYLVPGFTVDEEERNWLGPGYQLGVWGWTL